MKKITLLFILFLSFNQIAKAQSRLHLADSNAVWTMLNYSWDLSMWGVFIDYSQNQILITNTDTIINGNRFSYLYIRKNDFDTNYVNIGLIGEDSLNRITFYIYNVFQNIGYSNNADSLYGKPIIIADFSKTNNDSFNVYSNINAQVTNNYKAEVRGDSVGVQTIWINNMNIIQNSSYEFYERVGNLREGILHPFLKWFENGYQLICYKENGIELAPDSCDFTLNLNEKDYSNNQFDINTNIMNNYLLINFNSLVNVNQASIILYDLNGKEILNKHIEVNNNLCFVPLENLINGMYVLQMKIPNSKVDIRKKIILTN